MRLTAAIGAATVAVQRLVSMTAGPASLGVVRCFVRRAQAAPAVEDVGWVCRTTYWVSPDKTGLLASRLGAKFRFGALNRVIDNLIGAPL